MTQKRVKASDVIGNSYYIYTLQSSNNTPSLNSTINITCNVTNVYGQAVNGKSITLYQNNTSQGTKTTDSNGNASWNSISMSSAGLQTFKVENSKIEVFVDNKSDVGHTHSQYLTEHQSLSNYVTTDDSRLSDSRTPTSHTHGNLQNNGQVGSTAQANKNVVTNSSGLITTEDKPTIPSASSTTPSADTTNGSVGTGTTWARSNHTHPKSSLYAESSHNHTKSQITDFPSIPSKTSDLQNDSGFLTSHQDISGKIDTAGTGLSKSGTTLNHSNSITALTTASFKKVKYDGQGHITGTSDVGASDLPTHTHSQYLTEHQSLANYVQKSSTSGLLKNDGSVDTTQYLSSLPSHNHDDRYYTESEVDTALNGKANSSHTHTKSQITDLPTTFENGAIYVEGSNATTETTTNTFKATLPLSASDIVDGLKLVYKVSVTSTNSTSDLRLQLGLSNQTNESYIKANNTFTTANLYPRSTLLFLVRLNGGWHIVGTSTLENSNNKVSSWSSTTTDNHYPSEKLVKDSLDGKSDNGHTHSQYLTSHQDVSGKEDKSNKVTSISSSSTDTQYPSAKCVYDALTLKVNDKTRATSTFFPQDYEDESSSQCTWENPYKVTIADSGYLILDFSSMLEEIGDRVYFNIVTNNTINVVYDDVSIYSSSDTKSLYIQKQASDVFELYLFNSDEFTYLQNTYTKTTPTLRIAPTTANSTTVSFGNKMWYHYMHFIDRVYPIGSIYMSVNSVNPQYIIGGQWEQIEDRFLLASGSTYSSGSTGGSADAVVVSHTHTQNAHSHRPSTTSMDFLASNVNVAINGTKRAFPASGSSMYEVYASEAGGINEYNTTESVTATNQSTGVSGTGKNMPPYLVVYMWKRIA